MTRLSRFSGDWCPEDSSGHILGKINQNGARTAGGSNLESFVDSSRELSDVFDHNVPLCATSRNTDDIGFLESIGTNQVRGDLTTEDNHRHTVTQGILHRGNDIGSARTRSDKDNTWFARNASVAFRHVASTLLVSWKNEIEVRGVIDGVKDRKNGAAGITKDLLYVVTKHHLLEDLATGETDKSNDNLSTQYASSKCDLRVVQPVLYLAVAFKTRRISRHGLRRCLKVLGRLRSDSRTCSSSRSAALNFPGMGPDTLLGLDSHTFLADGSIVHGSWGVLSGRRVDVVGITVSGPVSSLEARLKDCVRGRDASEKTRLACKHFDDCR